MATRTYGPQTLNDNWFEDHAKPLNGTIADYGNREYGTTFKNDFKRSDLVDTRSGWQAKQGARRQRFGLGMVTTDNVQRYKDSITRENPSDFRALLPQPAKNETKFYDETTTASGFGRGTKDPLAEKKRRTGKAKGRSLFFAIEGDKTNFLMFLWRLSSWKNWTAAEGNASIQRIMLLRW